MDFGFYIGSPRFMRDGWSLNLRVACPSSKVLTGHVITGFFMAMRNLKKICFSLDHLFDEL